MSLIYGALRRLSRAETPAPAVAVPGGGTAQKEGKEQGTGDERSALRWWAKGLARLREDRRTAIIAAAAALVLVALVLVLVFRAGGKKAAVESPQEKESAQAQGLDAPRRTVPYSIAIPPVATRPAALAVRALPPLPGASPSRGQNGKEAPTLESLVAAAGGVAEGTGGGRLPAIASDLMDLVPEPESKAESKPESKPEPKRKLSVVKAGKLPTEAMPQLPPVAEDKAGTAKRSESVVKMDETTRINRIVQQFQQALRSRDVDKAGGLLKELAELKGPEHHFVLKMQAYWELQQGKDEQAGTLLRKVAAHWPEDLDVGLNLILVDMRLGNLGPAKERAMRLFVSHPDDPRLRELLSYMR